MLDETLDCKKSTGNKILFFYNNGLILFDKLQLPNNSKNCNSEHWGSLL